MGLGLTLVVAADSRARGWAREAWSMGVKQKTHKGMRKRFKVTAGKKVRYRRSFSGHLMSGKTGSRCRKLRRPAYLAPSVEKKVLTLMGE
jgi:large subunit ribosomal protein L35